MASIGKVANTQQQPAIRVREKIPARKRERSVPDPQPGSTSPEPLYRILEGSTPKLLEDKVTEAIADGWKVHGSPSLSVNGATSNVRYIQAMVRTGSIVSQPW